MLDFAPLREELDDSGVGRTGLTVTSNFIDDGMTGDYLIGLGEHLEVLIVYIDSEGCRPSPPCHQHSTATRTRRPRRSARPGPT